MNDNGVFRRSPATQGVLIRLTMNYGVYISIILSPLRTMFSNWIIRVHSVYLSDIMSRE